MSRANTFYASSADRERVHSVRMVEGEVRTITLDLAALIPSGESVDTASWALEGSGVVSLSHEATTPAGGAARLTATAPGSDVLTATVLLTNEEQAIERFVVEVA